jgi:hypothetical protein
MDENGLKSKFRKTGRVTKILHILMASTTMKKYLALLVVLLCYQTVFAQVDFARRFIKKMYFDKDSSKKSNLILVPALASSPETGL